VYQVGHLPELYEDALLEKCKRSLSDMLSTCILNIST